MSLSGITDKSETFLDVVHDSLVFRPYDYNVRLSYEIFIDLNLRTIDRQVYNAFVLFGDIGGFSSFFLVLLSLFVGSIPSKLFNMSATASLFRANLDKREKK